MKEDSPFYSYEHDDDPIMIAARLNSNNTISSPWRYCTEPTPVFHHDLHFNQPPLNLIALGRTGDGKSSLLNDLMGYEAFKQKISARSQTKDIQSKEGFWAPLHRYMHGKENFGCNIRVVDTPGFGDSQFRDKEFAQIIQEAILDTAIDKGGVHVILMVFKITANADTVYKSIEAFYNLISPYTLNDEFWNNVLLVFTHVDIVNGDTNRYQSHKIALKSKINRTLKEKYGFKQDLPMLWISTQKYICGFLKGLSDCDCERGNKYHSDCRRRLYEQVIKRRHIPFTLSPTSTEQEEQNDSHSAEAEAVETDVSL